ncbi:sulfate ABC transporter permease subunit CysW [Methylophaga lonarensis]|uniref:sulfate ABC transporter permease subunit CysW n=1 Tax=Methylophaga lonarensis TaxID=999151 RepID=UPI003D28284C
MSAALNRGIGQTPWVRRLLVSLAVLLTLVLLLAPLVFIFVRALADGPGGYIQNLLNPYTQHAILLTLFVAVITIPVNLVFGVMLAWLVTRFEFFGRKLLITIIDIPFTVSPVVAGLIYLLLYGNQGWIGGWLDDRDIQLMFAWPGLVMVTIFVTCPFVARELIPLMQQQGTAEEEAALTLGASGWQMFRHITLPNVRWALLYGVILTNARAMGEFGAVSVVSGSIRGQTNTLALHVELLAQDYNTVGAFVSASLLALLALVTLVAKSIIEWRQAQRVQQ